MLILANNNMLLLRVVSYIAEQATRFIKRNGPFPTGFDLISLWIQNLKKLP